MRFLDFSPPTVPSIEQQRDALQKGLGRAMQWAAAGVLALDPLLNACLHDQRYDSQTEDDRGEWLWNITVKAGALQLLRDPLLNALRSLVDGQNSFQLCELALCFARSGDATFRKWLYDSPDIGEEQLLRLDGEDAFLYIARLRGRHLAKKEWEWDDANAIDVAIEVIGEPRVRELLSNTLDADIRRFASDWLGNTTRSHDPDSVRQTRIQKMQAISVDRVLESVTSEDNCNWLRGWGMHADEPSLTAVLSRLWTEHDPVAIVKLLKVFSNRSSPQIETRWIELAEHPDIEVRRRAVNALKQNSHPLIRELALKQLRVNTFEFPAISLLIKNFEIGDEQRLFDEVELPEDPCFRHWMLMDVVKLLEQNELADCTKLGQIVYFNTPCQNCRFYAAKLLLDRKCMPAWMIDECRTDAEVDCRKLCEPESDTDKENGPS